MPSAHPHPDRRRCEHLLSPLGAALFLGFMRFTGLPTGRLFAWAKLLKEGAFPALSGPCQGKLVRTDISKWRAMLGESREPVIPPTSLDRKISLSHFTLRAHQEKINVLVAFEQVSETLLLYSTAAPLSASTIIGVVAELNRRATEKLGQEVHERRDCRIVMPKMHLYLEVAGTLCAPKALPEGKLPPKPPNRELKRVTWGTGQVHFYPLDWQAHWLDKNLLQEGYDLPAGWPLAVMREEIRRIAAGFNARSRQTKQLPSIEMLTRARHVSSTADSDAK